MKRNLFAMLLAVVMIAAVIFVAAPATKADASVYTADAENKTFTVSESCIININGVEGVTVTVTNAAAEISFVDTSFMNGENWDLTGESAGTATIIGECIVKDWVQYGNYKYLMVNTDGAISAHPFNLTLTRFGVSTNSNAVCVKATFVANDVVANLIAESGNNYGLHNYSLAGSTEHADKEYTPYNVSFAGKRSVNAYFDLMGSLDAENVTEEAHNKLGVYIKIGDTLIESKTTVDLYPTDILAKINSEYPDYIGRNRTLALKLYKNNAHLQAALSALAPRDITSGPLTAGEIDALQNLDIDELWDEQNFAGAVKNVFESINIDLGGRFTKTVNGTFHTIFKWVSDTEEKLNTWPADSTVDNYKMLVTDYYGGKTISWFDKIFTADDFEIGDIFIAQQTSPSKEYYTGIYMGDGKFIMYRRYGTTTVDETTVFSETLGTDMDFYCVLRPSQVATYSATRTIGTGKLSETEKYWISQLTADNLKNSWLLDSFAPKVYNAVGINVSSYFGIPAPANTAKTLTNVWMAESLFCWENSKRVVRPNNYKYYLDWANEMLVEDYYGGTDFATSRTFKPEDFEIGDLFVGWISVGGSNRYYTAVYQGNGVFLAADHRSGSYVYTTDTTTVFANDIGSTFVVYYVLRPGQFTK